MRADFSGWATKHNLKCADGRTIMPDAFKHLDKMRVPLVWQHQHNDPANVLGHAILEARPEGVYTYAYFNDTENGQNAKRMVKHGDITALSIYANQLAQQGRNVVHGNITEVSLVIAGANPGAMIDNVNLQHGDGSLTTVDEEAVIFTDEELVIEEPTPVVAQVVAHTNQGPVPTTQEEAPMAPIQHAAGDETVQDVLDTFNEKQLGVLHYLLGEAVDLAEDGADIAQADMSEALVHTLQEGFETMARNVFENGDGDTLVHSGMGGGLSARRHLSREQLGEIIEDAKKMGSLKDAVLAHAGDYGIDNIDILFPDARAVANAPEVIGRRQEWVNEVISGTKHSPFSRIKSTAVDLTADEARAKGYVRGNLKKEEVIRLLKRVTTPTTIYKKQKLDRDDVIDIVDLDVVAWLKAEMRVMLDEELARAVLIGDGRESDDEDKIDTDHIRPIAYDADMYAHQVTIASDVTPNAIIENVLRARTNYKGTGQPTFYTTDAILTDLILIEDKVGRRIYTTEADLAAALRVRKIVTVEVMDSAPEIVGIIVNLADYTLGADQGGQVSMFDDFDIDYNQLKYLIETRVSGALTKPKSALVIKRTIGTSVTPTSPSFNGTTNTITIPTTTGVVYSIDGNDVTGAQVIDEITEVEARPAPNYSFPANTPRNWTYSPSAA